MGKIAVAPLVGAWIEIILASNSIQATTVAPLVGAWIEIKSRIVNKIKNRVAPLVGAWIEIMGLCDTVLSDIRRSPCGSVD